jgi:hypothetical protein
LLRVQAMRFDRFRSSPLGPPLPKLLPRPGAMTRLGSLHRSYALAGTGLNTGHIAASLCDRGVVLARALRIGDVLVGRV